MEPIPKLVLRAQCGDRQALADVIEFVAPQVARYVVRIAKNDALAEDIAQDSLILICRKLKNLRNPEVFRFWALRIASRTAFRALGKRRMDVTLDDAEQGAMRDKQAEDEVIQGITNDAVERLLATVPPRCGAVLALHYLEGYSLTEVADVLEIPVGTVKSRLSYGIKTLRTRSLER